MKTFAERQTRLIYPVHNSLLLPLEYIPRYVKVIAERSIADQPLSLAAFLKRPFLRRGVTLITAFEDGREKHFYRECCKGRREPGLQFVIIDPSEPDDTPEPVSEVFMPTAEDRRMMIEIAEFVSVPPGLALAIRAVA